MLDHCSMSANPNQKLDNWRIIHDRIHVSSVWDHEPHSEVKFTLWQQFGRQVTGIIGLREALTSKHAILRVIWSLLLLAGISITAFFVYQTTREYLDEPTATKVKLNISATFDIPPMAVCPSAWWDSEAAYNLGLTPDALKYSLGYIDDFRGMKLNISKGRDDFHEFYSRNNFSSLVDYFMNITLQLTPVYSNHEFRNQSEVIKIGDPNSTMIGKIFAGYEVCYAFSFRPSGTSLSSTALNIKFNDKTGGTADMIPSAWVELITDLDLMDPLLPPLYIATFTRTKIQVSANRLVTLNKPEAPCLEEPGDTTMAAYGCSVVCQNREYKKSIGCHMLRYSTINTVSHPSKYCNVLDSTTTGGYKYSDYRLSKDNERISTVCAHECLPWCDRMVYQTAIQWQQWLPKEGSDGEMYAELFFEHTARYAGEILAFVEVNTYSFTDLINNVGGTLGLFIGATVMTFAQIILFSLDYILSRVKAAATGKDQYTVNRPKQLREIFQDDQNNLKAEVERLKEANEKMTKENQEIRQGLLEIKMKLLRSKIR